MHLFVASILTRTVAQLLKDYYTAVIGASLSEPHIDETNAHNPYLHIYLIFFLVRPSRMNRHKHCTVLRGIFQKAA